MNREYMCAYHSLIETMEQLTDAEFGRLLRVALRYSRDHEVEEVRGREAMLWPVLKWQIDRNNAAYEAKCQQNRANGQRGGRPSTRETERPAENRTVFSETEKTHNKDKDKEEDTIPPIYPPQGGQRAQDGESKGSPPPAAACEEKSEYSADFTAFWKSYPSWRATDKAGCYRKFKKIPKDQLPRVMESLEAHKRSKQWRDGIIPLASTWLNQRRWESDAPPPPKSNGRHAAAVGYEQRPVDEAAMQSLIINLDGGAE